MPQVCNWQVQKELQFKGATSSMQAGLNESSNQYRRNAVLKNFGENRRMDGYNKYLKRNEAIQKTARERIMNDIKTDIHQIHGYRKATRRFRYDRLVTLHDPEEMELREFEERPRRTRQRLALESQLMNGGWNPTRLKDEVKKGLSGDEQQLKKDKFLRKLKGHVQRVTKEGQLDETPLKQFYRKRKDRSIALAQQRLGSPTTKSMKLYASGADTYINRKTVVDTSFLNKLRVPYTHFRKMRAMRQPLPVPDVQSSSDEEDEEDDVLRTSRKSSRGSPQQHRGLTPAPPDPLQPRPSVPSRSGPTEELSSMTSEQKATKSKPPLVKREPSVIKVKPAVIDKDMVKRGGMTKQKSSLKATQEK